MYCKRMIKKALLLLLAISLLVGSGAIDTVAETPQTDKQTSTVTATENDDSYVLENDGYILSVNKDPHEILLTDKKSSMVWKSVPDKAEEDAVATGKERTNLRSTLVISYLNTDKQLVDTANTMNGCSSYNSGTGESVQTIRIVLNENAIMVYYIFADLKIIVPVRFCLTDNGMECSIIPNEIVEDAEYRLLTIALLPYFGAGGTDEQGYLLLPDGSGALAYFNQNKANYQTYDQPVYGRDESFDILMDSDKVQSVRMPIFGISKSNGGLFGIITESESQASVQASVNGQNSSYSQVGAVFAVRTVYTYSMGEATGGKPQSVTVYEEKVLSGAKYKQGNFSVRYFPLDAQNGDYSGMARVYRNYLMEKTGMKEKSTRAAVHLEFPGAIRTKGKLFGITTYSTKPLNTTEDVLRVTQGMLDSGVENIAVKYTDWTKQQLKGQINTKASLISKLGGNSGLKNLIATLTEKKVSLHLHTDYYDVAKLQIPYFKSVYAARNVSQQMVRKYVYELTSAVRDPYAASVYIISPSVTNGLAEKFMKSFTKKQGAQISVGSIGSLLASDFSDDGWTRQHSLLAVQETLKTLSEGNAMMIEGGNVYALPYADMVIDAPNDSSHFNISDETVPFYQLVVSGLVEYSYEAINSSGDPWKLLLKSIETGAGLHYYFVSQNEEELPNTAEYTRYTSVDPSYWAERAGEYYTHLKKVSTATDGSAMVSHRMISENVYETMWGNGCRVLVNYQEKDVTVGDVVIPARDYHIMERGDVK